MPTTLGMPGRFGACSTIPVSSVSLIFGSDGSFRQEIGSAYAGSTFEEKRVGELVVINDVDTAHVAQGTMRVTLTSIDCLREELVAKAIP